MSEKKEKKKINKIIVSIKFKALKLKNNYQIPTYLYRKIIEIGEDNYCKEYIYHLEECLRDYIRVKGYYKDKVKNEKACIDLQYSWDKYYRLIN